MKFRFPTGYHGQKAKANAVISFLPRDNLSIWAPSPSSLPPGWGSFPSLG